MTILVLLVWVLLASIGFAVTACTLSLWSFFDYRRKCRQMDEVISYWRRA